MATSPVSISSANYPGLGAETPAVRRRGPHCGRVRSRQVWRARRRRRGPASRPNDAARETDGGRLEPRPRARRRPNGSSTLQAARAAFRAADDGRRWASIDFPAPGAPLIKRLWPPAAATSSARLALSWPLMSRRSGCGPTEALIQFGRDSTCEPLKWLASWISERGARMSRSAEAHAASGPQSAGQIKPLPAALAAIAAGRTPATALIGAVERQFPNHREAVESVGRNGADRRHHGERDRQIVMASFLLGMSAGARLTVIRLAGSARPEAIER